jgi:RNA-directed DNA polymerase
MPANLAVREFDARVSRIADDAGLAYARYADDLVMSAAEKQFGNHAAGEGITKAFGAMTRFGLPPNLAKAAIVPRGGRKIALGLLVDRDRPHPYREFKANLRRHLRHFDRNDVDLLLHAAGGGFSSVVGLRNHVRGLISFARQIEPECAVARLHEFDAVGWPV